MTWVTRLVAHCDVCGHNRGWVVAEMIGPGNVHNFKAA